MTKLFITGIPGTGKTTLGNHLADKNGFVHVDLEEENNAQQFVQNIDGFIGNLGTDRIILSWGFAPVPEAVKAVIRLRDLGFAIVWLDGDREAALQLFKQRGDVPEELFHAQIYRIESSKLVEQLKPLIINVFAEDGSPRDTASVAEEILENTE